MIDKVEMYVRHNYIANSYELYGFMSSREGMTEREPVIRAAKSMTFVEVEPGNSSDPFVKLTRAEAQFLMDELYRAGIRPSDLGSAGQVEALKLHLEDMRRLVFDRKKE